MLDTRFGVVWGLGAIAWALIGLFAAIRPQALPALRPATVGAAGSALPGPGPWTWALAVPVAALALLPGLGGHAGVQDPVAILLPANALHVLAAGAWIGGLAVLVAALPAATRRLEPPERTRVLSATLGRFSGLALVAVALLLAGGIAQSLLELGAVDDLWDTPFGRAIAIKAALVIVLLGLGALNRRRTLPRLAAAAREGSSPGGAGVLLRRTLRAEVALGVAALAVTGALAGYPPATAVSAGPVLRLRRPRPRPRRAHRRAGPRGRQRDPRLPLRPLRRAPVRRAEGAPLRGLAARPRHRADQARGHQGRARPLRRRRRRARPAGDWRLELVARVSDFDELRTTYTVPIE